MTVTLSKGLIKTHIKWFNNGELNKTEVKRLMCSLIKEKILHKQSAVVKETAKELIEGGYITEEGDIE